jgi:mlo protein
MCARLYTILNKNASRKHLIWITLKQMLGAFTFHLLRLFKVMGFFLFFFFFSQMGTNYKAALIPQRIRETIHGWGKAARRRRRRHGVFTDDSTIHTDTSTVMSIEEDDDQELLDAPETGDVACTEIELQPASAIATTPSPVANETSSRIGTPLLRPSASVSSSVALTIKADGFLRSFSMPTRGE